MVTCDVAIAGLSGGKVQKEMWICMNAWLTAPPLDDGDFAELLAGENKFK
jgi:hypothetical protein